MHWSLKKNMGSKSSKYILTCGCSFTDKDYEKHTYVKINYDPFPKWPELLGKKLNKPVKNIAISGASNDYIFRLLLSDILENHEKIETVIVAWSEWTRAHIYNGVIERFDKPRNSFNMSYLILHPESKKYKFDGHEFSKHYWAGKNYLDDVAESTLRNMHELQILCDKFNINLIQSQMLNVINPTVFDKKYEELVGGKEKWHYFLESLAFNKHLIEIKKETFIGWPGVRELGGNALDYFLSKEDRLNPVEGPLRDTHPNEKGHELLSKIYYNRYKELYL